APAEKPRIVEKAPTEKPPAEKPRALEKAPLEKAQPEKLPPPSFARPVRVRFVDGSQVVGVVRAELSEALVVECPLGLLSIPRARISTIAYDAAAHAGAKHAPVQQLDD